MKSKLVGKRKASVRKKEWQKNFVKKCAEIYSLYEKSFEEAVLEGTIRSKDVMNLVKIMVAPMRFGKTRLAITHHIPFLLKHTDVECIIFTSPLGSIIKQKQRLIKKTIRKLDDVEYCDHPVDAIEALEDGSKVVITMTNQAAWVGDKAIELYNSLDKSKTAFIVDEAHTWTTDCKENLGNVVGGGGENSKFKGALYQRLKEFAPHTPFIFGLTATTNNQHDGLVPALGNMQYVVINKDFVKDGEVVQDLAYRLGWFDPERVRYMDDTTLFGKPTQDHFNDMIGVLMRREKLIKKKLTVFIEAKRKEKGADDNECLAETLNYIKESNFEANDVDENSPVTFMMHSKEIAAYNINGKKLNNVDEKTVYACLADSSHPSRFLIVVDMAKMGVDLPTTKLMFSFRTWPKKADDFETFGYIIESALQKFGRLLTGNSGVSEKEFFDEYFGDFRNVPDFHPEMNMMDYWVMGNGMNEEAMSVYGEIFAPSKPDMESHLKTFKKVIRPSQQERDAAYKLAQKDRCEREGCKCFEDFVTNPPIGSEEFPLSEEERLEIYIKGLEVDHVDRNLDNLDPENLKTYCPNAHSGKTMKYEDYMPK